MNNRQELVGLIRDEFSGQRALDIATEITRFYRSPGASGYHRVTDYVADLFRAVEIDDVWVERFPLDGETRFPNQSMPLAQRRRLPALRGSGC